MRFFSGILFLCICCTFSFSVKDNDVLNEIEIYLNKLSKNKIEINQINANGLDVQGILFLDRKNKKLRINYPSIKQYMLARVGFLYFVDEKEKTIDYVDASYTPIGFLFKENIKFNKNIYVKHISKNKNDILITLTESKNSEKGGALTLHFQKNKKLFFKGWAIDDMQGNITQVQIINIKNEVSFEESLFDKPELKDLKNAKK